MNFKEETVYSNVETANSKQLAILKKHFPNCFDRDGNFIQERMLEVVNEGDIELSKESYSLNWLGKSYSRLLANLPPKTLINEDVEHNLQDQHKDSKNLLIKGDNLEVLKHLVNAYSEKVKMIYIDPPYNTGSDGFIYNDDRKFTKEQLSELANIDIEEAERILSFTDKGSSSHSAWLTFMYPRLCVARELLKDDGVIFISIDSNEVSQLKMLCDEIFSEQNYLAELIWKRRAPSAMADNNISIDHEYVLVYQKGNLEGFQGIEKDFMKYKNLDNDPRGDWVLGDLTVGMTEGMRPNQAYDLVDPKTGSVFPHNPNRVWAFIPPSMEKMIKEGRVVFPKDSSKRPMQKRFKDELKSTYNPLSSIIIDKVGLNTEATKQIQELLNGNVFEYSKPVSLLTTLIPQVCAHDDIVMDFFAGSGTTSQAVMQHNIANKSSVRFVSIQLDEATKKGSNAYSAGYMSIFEITKKRLTKAAEKLRSQNSEMQCDLGFKIFETVEDFRVEVDDKELTLSNLTMFDDAHLTAEQYATLLTTWALYDGSELTTPILNVELGGYTAHLCDRRLYMIASDFSSDALKALLHKLDDTDDKGFDPNKVVYYANNFDSVKQMELNEALKSYGNKKSIEIDVVVRN